MAFVKSLSTCIASIALLLPMTSQAQVEVKEITTRPGVTVKFVYAKATNPVASAILFPDGFSGNPIFANGDVKNPNFLASDVAKFVQNGVSVIFADVPSDQSSWNKFRNTSEHAADNTALLAFLKQQANAPVWAIGHGNGGLSAAAFALANADIVGLVLASPTQRAPFGASAAHPVSLAALDQIKQPTLLLQHKDDGCMISKYDGAKEVLAALKSTKKNQFITLEGGSSSTGIAGYNNSCYRGYHGYFCIEDAVIKQMTDWIKATQAETKPAN
jgi:dienelactone hydrolase